MPKEVKQIKETASKPLALFSLVLYLLGFAFFNVWFIFAYYFFHDFECSSMKNFPRMSYNSFNICEKINCGSNDSLYKILFNSFLIFQFWMQHYIMISPSFKWFICSLIPKYLIFERFLFLLASFIHNTILIWFWQPLPMFSYQLPDIFYKIFLVISFSGLGFQFFAIFLIRTNDVFGISNAIKLLKTGEIIYPPKFKLVQIYVYSLCRNPMMLGFFINLVFSSIKFNVGRLLFIAEMMFYTYYGVILEEQYIAQRGIDEVWAQYVKRVPRFLPFGKWITSDNEIKKLQ